MLLHDQKSEDSIKNFFNEIYELYVKVYIQIADEGNGQDEYNTFFLSRS